MCLSILPRPALGGWQCEVQAGAAGSGNERKRDWPIEAGAQANCLLRFDVAFLFKPGVWFSFWISHSETTYSTASKHPLGWFWKSRVECPGGGTVRVHSACVLWYVIVSCACACVRAHAGLGVCAAERRSSLSWRRSTCASACSKIRHNKGSCLPLFDIAAVRRSASGPRLWPAIATGGCQPAGKLPEDQGSSRLRATGRRGTPGHP